MSAAPSGYVMDKFGRKSSLLFLSIVPLSSWLMIVLSKSVLMLCIARFLSGIWLCVIYTIIPMYIAEISEPQIRGSLGNFTSFMSYIGVLFVYVTGSYVSYYTLSIICAIIPVIFICTCVWLPESPYYYLMEKNVGAAKKSLMWLRDGDENQIEMELTRVSKAVELEMESTGNIKDILGTKGNRKALLITEVLSVNQKFSGSTAIMAYASVTLPSDALPSIGTNGCVIILGSVWVISGFVLMFFIDRVGRKTLLFISCFGCGLAMLVLSIWYYLYEKTDINVNQYNYIPFYCFVFHGMVYSLALGPIVNCIKGELFPSNVKAIASFITTVVLALTSFVINKMYLVLVDLEGFYVDFIIFSVVSLLGAVFTLTVVIETKGKTLQDIQIELNGGKVENI